VRKSSCRLVVPPLREVLQPWPTVVLTVGSSKLGKSFINLRVKRKQGLILCNLSRRGLAVENTQVGVKPLSRRPGHAGERGFFTHEPKSIASIHPSPTARPFHR
jgi:hypothetical protein